MGESSASISGKKFFLLRSSVCVHACVCMLIVWILACAYYIQTHTHTILSIIIVVVVIYTNGVFYRLISGFRSQQRTCSFVCCVPKPAAAAATYEQNTDGGIDDGTSGFAHMRTFFFFGIKIYRDTLAQTN